MDAFEYSSPVPSPTDLMSALNSSTLSSNLLSMVEGTTRASGPSPDGAFTDSYSCHRAPNAKGEYLLRGVAIGAVLLVSVIFGILPWILRGYKKEHIFFFCSVFAGGVLLSSGFIHILPEADADLRDPCLQLSDDFPWAFVICATSLILTFTAEYYLRSIIRGALSKKYCLGEDLQKVITISHDYSSYLELGVANGRKVEMSLTQRAQARDQKVACYMLQAGVMLHSFFLGLNVGVTSDPDYLRSLVIAVTFQQGFEAIALGASYIRGHFPNLTYFILLSAFCMTAPSGIAIGIGISRTYDANGKVALAFQGVFNAFSSGILIYNGLVDVILPAFSAHTLLIGRLSMRLLATFCLIAGFAVMTMLAKWA